MKNIPKLPLFLRIISNKIRNIFSISKYLRGILYFENCRTKIFDWIEFEDQNNDYDDDDVPDVERSIVLVVSIILSSSTTTLRSHAQQACIYIYYLC